VYCSEDPSTALVETLVHIEIDSEDRPDNSQVLKIESSQEVSIEPVDIEKLGSEWRSDLARTRRAGDEWLQSSSLLLEVPSVLVPERRNYWINPIHPDMKNCGFGARYTHPFDQRLLR
jgi:RES domain-containing protein